jgi:hypothetical protein
MLLGNMPQDVQAGRANRGLTHDVFDKAVAFGTRAFTERVSWRQRVCIGTGTRSWKALLCGGQQERHETLRNEDQCGTDRRQPRIDLARQKIDPRGFVELLR